MKSKAPRPIRPLALSTIETLLALACGRCPLRQRGSALNALEARGLVDVVRERVTVTKRDYFPCVSSRLVVVDAKLTKGGAVAAGLILAAEEIASSAKERAA